MANVLVRRGSTAGWDEEEIIRAAYDDEEDEDLDEDWEDEDDDWDDEDDEDDWDDEEDWDEEEWEELEDDDDSGRGGFDDE